MAKMLILPQHKKNPFRPEHGRKGLTAPRGELFKRGFVETCEPSYLPATVGCQWNSKTEATALEHSKP
jgi:hypothetical protein